MQNSRINELILLIEERKDELFELLSKYVKVDSRSFGESGLEKELAELIAEDCKALGLETEVYSPLDIDGFTALPDYMDGRALENRLNVTAVYRGESDENGLHIMGHSDTVEFGDESNWKSSPLSGKIEDGRVWGRGACDDKYALATSVFLMRILRDMGFKPKKNLVFSAYCDEEYGGSHGAMAAVIKAPSERIVNMDGRFSIWNCASGGQEAIYRYHTEKTVDSAELGARVLPVVLDGIAEFGKRRCEELEKNPHYSGTHIPKTSLRYMGIKVGNSGSDLGVGELIFTYYTDKSREEIYSELEVLGAELSKKLKPLGIIGDGFFPKTRFFHYGYTTPNDPAIVEMQQAVRDVCGEDVPVVGSCLSDLSVIFKYGKGSAFAFGAGRDFSMPGGAHQPNEFIECDSLLKYAKAIGAYIVRSIG